MSKNINKEFKLSSWSINNKSTVFVVVFILIFAGWKSYDNMPREAFPEVVSPQIFVSTPYPGNSALDIEKLLTRPLEKEINGISGVDEITSTSLQGYSSISVLFDFEITPDEALRKVKDKVDAAMSDKDFPKDLPADPNVVEMNFAEMVPIMNINLSGEFSMDQLKDYAEYLEDEIEELPEISKVDIRGVQDKEIEVSVDMYKMEASEISFGDIAGAISNENITISGGDLLENGIRRDVRVIGEFNSAKEIEDIIVKQEKGNIVYLRDIAQVNFKEQEKESYAREFSQPVVMLDVIKRGGENLIKASESIDAILAKAKEDIFPASLIISKTNDMSNDTKNQVSNLENSIIFGVLLVVLVLMFFLGLRNALFVGVAIPMSMFLSFILLGAAGVTLNMMVLFALVLALGMLVDNGIVVVENIYRLLDEGYSKTDAAKYGVGEVAMPIIASTATTLAAFLPLAFWPGMMGEFMKFLPITLIIVLGSSLFVALVINPVLTAIYMKIKEDDVPFEKVLKISTLLVFLGVLIILGTILDEGFLKFFGWGFILFSIGWVVFNKLSNGVISRSVLLESILSLVFGIVVLWGVGDVKFLNALGLAFIVFGILRVIHTKIFTPITDWTQSRLLPYFENLYERLLRFSLAGKRVYLFFFGTIALLIFSIMLFGAFPPKVLFFPDSQAKQVFVFIEYPIGTDIETTNMLSKKVENRIEEHLKKYQIDGESYLITSVIGQVGEGTADPSQGAQGGKIPNRARITVDFVKFQDRRGVDTNVVMSDIRNLLLDYPGVKIVVDKPADGPPAGAPINIEVRGDDYEELMQTAIKMKQFIDKSNILGVEELKIDVEQGKPQMPIIVDRQKARRLNVSTGQIGDALRTSLFGKEVSTFKDGEDDYPINIRLMNKYRYSKEALINQKLTFRDQGSGKIVQVPISAVAHAETATTFSAVKRKDLNRVITIYSNVLEDYNATEINEEIASVLADFNMPKGVQFSFTGEQEKQAEQMAFLSKALLIAVFMIFLIMVGQFNSAATPVIISLSVLLSLIGVLLGLIIFNMEFIIMMTMIGIISLAGIVVNNAIVLIDYTNLVMLRKRAENNIPENQLLPKEMVFESIVEGGKTRLRPVILTAVTTILGLLPLAIGLNINFMTLFTEFDPQYYIGGENKAFWGPMSWTIIFGLTFATFLTLVIVPVMYFILNRAKLRFSKSK